MIGSAAEDNLHRNNAAEWLMWIVLWPIGKTVLLFQKIRSRRRIEPRS